MLSAVSASAAASLVFAPPQLVGPSMGPAYFIGVDGAAGSGERLVFGENGGEMRSLSNRTGAALAWRASGRLGLAETFPSQCDSPCTSVETFGAFVPVLSGSAQAVAFNASGGRCFSVADNGAGASVREAPAAAALRTFRGLPRPVISGKFSSGGFRLGGSASARLSNSGALLATAIVTFAGQEHLTYPQATSVVLFRSTDGAGARWDYVSTVADACDFPWSQEGPNEMDLVVLPGAEAGAEAGADAGPDAEPEAVLVVVRMDGGDGPVSHPYANYYRALSVDGGATWAPPTPIANAGCARPRLLRLGRRGALLSGGRMRNANTSDVLLWHNGDARDPASPWVPHSLSDRHNAGTGPPPRFAVNASLRFDAHVNSTTFGPRQTNAYTSLARLNESAFVVTYDMHLVGRPAGLRCTGWPTAQHDKAGCEQGGDALRDGYRYWFNAGRGTPGAVCGEGAGCDCCRNTTLPPVPAFEGSFSMVGRLRGSLPC